MNKTLAILLLCVAGCKTTDSSAGKPGAWADLMDGQGQKVGSATFTQTADGVKIHVEITKLPAGTHALHIHTVGACHGPEFKTAGAHFNPDKKKHGLKNPEGPHAGDLENFDVAADGTAKVDRLAKLVTLNEGVSNSLFQPGGTCIVVHEKADDNMTDPAGNAGNRIACGVITKSR